MIVYEVRAAVDGDVADAYRQWLDGHIREILAIPGFTGAELLAEDEPEPGRRVWTVRYHLADRGALERYLRDHAPRLRAEGVERFGARFSTSRRVLELVRSFEHDA